MVWGCVCVCVCVTCIVIYMLQKLRFIIPLSSEWYNHLTNCQVWCTFQLLHQHPILSLCYISNTDVKAASKLGVSIIAYKPIGSDLTINVWNISATGNEWRTPLHCSSRISHSELLTFFLLESKVWLVDPISKIAFTLMFK